MGFADLVAATDRAVQAHLGSVTVRYRPECEDPIEITGVFDERYVLVDPANAGVEQIAPVLFLRVEDLPIHPDGDDPTIEIAEQRYQVVERMPDGFGGIRLRLHRIDRPGCSTSDT